MIYIWKEFKEQSRGKGLWLSFIMLGIVSLFLLLQVQSYPVEQGFTVFLISLYEMMVLLLPLLCLFIGSFSIWQEKEQRTHLILLAKRESYRGFLFKKSLAIQVVMMGMMTLWLFVLALPMKFLFSFDVTSFLAFWTATLVLSVIFSQMGIFWGSVAANRMQIVGLNLFTWFFFLFVIDLVTLFYLPAVNYENIKLFSFLYFLNPIHALQIFLETSIGLFPINHMSRLMERLIWLPPILFMLFNLVFWTMALFEGAVRKGRKGNYP
ncbi:ABC transporter permease subunit [Ammoniphilus sp. CFH 90114]|uniref:ABC transporter permease subunit n=1 Tax=Ammoniphilus sp. CFH 90114 TaxID=2493665 RepID=UPI00100D9D4D|nr:ABC transporter permease subunit [Ammoniphilus sp. CFH 90114]RXT03790.1 copper ABC transporter permease [Ammoniphilus sp. CFH 90114]